MSDIKIGSVWQGKNNEGDVKIKWANHNRVHYIYLNTLGGENGDVYDVSVSHFLEYFEHKADMVNNPPHYKDVSGIECIEVTSKMSFCGGNCFKYLYRAGKKGSTVEDLKKAIWYAERACELGENLNQEARDKIREVRRYRELGIQNAMRAMCFSNWMLVIEWIECEISRLESE